MDQPGFANRPAQNLRLIALGVALALCVFAIAIRAAMLFSKLLPPGIDAAYYPMQARGVLENGKLPYVEVPLIFWIDAALAKVLMMTRGMDVDGATLLASRLVDAVSQPLTAIPLALLMVGFAGAIRASRGANELSDVGPNAPAERATSSVPILISVFVVGAIAILSPPILRMTGDFQKNSLGLVWMAAGAWATYRAMNKGGIGCWTVVGVLAVLAAMTHIGAFGVTVVLIGSTIGVFVLAKWRMRPKALAIAAVSCAIGAGALWSLTYAVAPSKATGLLRGVPKMLIGGDRPQGRPAMAGDSGRPGPDLDRRPLDEGARSTEGFDRPMRDGGPSDRLGGGSSGPPGGIPAGALPFRVAGWVVLLAFGGVSIWKARRIGLPALAAISGAVFTAALVTLPLIQGQYAERLSLMTPIPLAIIVGFLVLSWAESARSWVRLTGPGIGAFGAVAILVAAIPVAMRGKGGPPPRNFAINGDDFARNRGPDGRGGPGGGSVVADEAVPEFGSMRGIVPTDGSAVVIARHGLQWWAGYFLKTPVREEHATKEQLEKYSMVFILQEVSAERSRPIPVGGEGGRDPSPPRENARLPANARLVFDGAHYRLFEAPKSEFESRR